MTPLVKTGQGSSEKSMWPVKTTLFLKNDRKLYFRAKSLEGYIPDAVIESEQTRLGYHPAGYGRPMDVVHDRKEIEGTKDVEWTARWWCRASCD